MKVGYDLSALVECYPGLYMSKGQAQMTLLLEDTNGLEEQVTLKDVITFPGLFNSHDHLEFNLFPLTKNGIYPGYKEWGADIHKRIDEKFKAILKVPIELRIKWGILKNLINGITFIAHHGEHHNYIRSLKYPVFLDYQFLHSLETEPFWKLKLNNFSTRDVMVHVGEGISDEYRIEINDLVKWNLLKRNLIGVHGVAMGDDQSSHFKSLIWCPDSNMRLYNQTAHVDRLKWNTKILFGTDSSLTSSSNLWEQLRLARSLQLLTEEEIFETLTRQPFDVFKGISQNGFVIAKRKSNTIWDSFFGIEPEDILMVMIHGSVVLMDHSIINSPAEGFATIRVGSSVKLIQDKWASVVSELESMKLRLPMNVSHLRLG